MVHAPQLHSRASVLCYGVSRSSVDAATLDCVTVTVRWCGNAQVAAFTHGHSHHAASSNHISQGEHRGILVRDYSDWSIINH